MSSEENRISVVRELFSNDENDVVHVEQKNKVTTNKGIKSSSTQRRLKQPLVIKTNIMIKGEESTSSVEEGRRAAATTLVNEYGHGLDLDLEHQSPTDSKEVAQKVENERRPQIDKEVISAGEQQARELQEKELNDLTKKYEKLEVENKVKKEELTSIQQQIKTLNNAMKKADQELIKENDIKSQIDKLKSKIQDRQDDLKYLNDLMEETNEKGLKHKEEMDELDEEIEGALNELAVVKFKISEIKEADNTH